MVPFWNWFNRRQPPPFNPRCCVFVRPDGGWIFPQNDRAGLGVMVAPVEKVEPNANEQTLGTAILRALARSRREQAPHGEPFTGSTAAEEAGFKNHADLERGSAYLGVHRVADKVILSAWAASKGGGYESVPGAECSCPVDPAAIGRGVLQLLPRCVRRGAPKVRPAPDSVSAAQPARGDSNDAPIGFGYKMCWIAVPSRDTHAVAQAISARQAENCSWQDGIGRAYELEGVFVTPPIDGWTLAAGALPEAGQPEFIPFLETLSRRFGQAFYFGTHRIVEYQAWARAERGAIRRAFAYLGERGEFLLNLGERTAEEIEIEVGVEDLEGAPDEEAVLSMAAQWVLDPRELDGHTEANGPGVFAVRHDSPQRQD